MIELHNIYIYPCKISKTVKVIEKISIGFFVTPFNYSARYPTGYPARPDIRPDRISGRIPDIRQNRLAGYPANSVSGATLPIFKLFSTKGDKKQVFQNGVGSTDLNSLWHSYVVSGAVFII